MMAITQDRSAIIWKENRMGISDILEKGLEYLVNLLVRRSICPGHVTHIAHGPAQGPPLYAQCLSIAARKKHHHVGDE